MIYTPTAKNAKGSKTCISFLKIISARARKITVLKRTFHQDLVNTYLEEGCRPQGPCECFNEGQEFIVDPSKAPGEFFDRCPWAWAEIYKAILNVASGANMIGAKQPGISIAGCTDWFRPVIFKIERLC